MVGDQNYQDETLHSIISEYRKNQIYAKEHFEERKREMMEQAADELKRAALKKLEEESQQELEKSQTEHGEFTENKDHFTDISEIEGISTDVGTFGLSSSEFVSASELLESMEKGMSTSPRNVKQDKRDLKINKLIGGKNSDVKTMQLATDLRQLQLKIEIFLKEYKENPNNWVLETYYNEKVKQKELSLEPIWAYDYLDKYVFSNYDMVILMSGTILDKNLFCQLNGLDVSKAVYYSIRSPFNPKNRPIFYMPVGKMSYKSKEETFKFFVLYAIIN
jgi:Rad3-related DNA helicase